MLDTVQRLYTATNAEDCPVCRIDYRDAPERIAHGLLCARGFDEAC